jgi:hypothetical protein
MRFKVVFDFIALTIIVKNTNPKGVVIVFVHHSYGTRKTHQVLVEDWESGRSVIMGKVIAQKRTNPIARLFSCDQFVIRRHFTKVMAFAQSKEQYELSGA